MIVLISSLVILLLCFYLLAVICDEFFVPSLDILSNKLKLSSDVAGATLMAIGSSAPEFFSSLFAVLSVKEIADVGAGTIVGSAIFNILVIIGASALFKTVKLTWQPIIRDTVFYILTILLLLFVFWDGKIVLIESIYFVVAYCLYIYTVISWKKWLPYKDVDPIDVLDAGTKKNLASKLSKRLLGLLIPDCHKHPQRYLLTFLLSITLIAGLSFLLIESVVAIGEILHINPTLLALTVLAAGTSIPDLFSSLIVAKQGRGDMAVSNAVGSNIFDILIGLGVPWFIVLTFRSDTVSVSNENLMGSVFLLFATVVAILFILVVRKWKIGQRSGIVLLALYGMYVLYVLQGI